MKAKVFGKSGATIWKKANGIDVMEIVLQLELQEWELKVLAAGTFLMENHHHYYQIEGDNF